MVPIVRRTLERGAAVGVALFGGVVAFDSLRHEIGWQATGPAPGYFPFRVGLLLMVASGILFVQASRGTAGERFATSEGLARTLSMFVPTLVLVAGMFLLGSYVPSALYLAWMMRRHGEFSWARAAIGAALIVVALFLIFERWFQVPLAKGAIESALGLY